MHVYCIERPDGQVKIGKTLNPSKRLRDLQNAGGFTALRVWFSVATRSHVEFSSHGAFADKRTVGEWFDVPFDDAVSMVSRNIDAPEGEFTRAGKPQPSGATFSQRLISARNSLGMSQFDLAVKAGTSRDVIAKSEVGTTRLPKEVESIASALGVPAGWLAFGEHSEADAILSTLTEPQRAQALRMLAAFAESCRAAH